MAFKYQCGDFLQFQEVLKQMRDLDDKIIYSLNTSIPTESFKGQQNPEQTCKDLYGKLQIGHKSRNDAIRECILVSANEVKKLREERDKDLSNLKLDKQFKFEQRKLRMLQSELNVEDIVRDRTFKAFNERCRNFFKVNSL